MTKELISLLHHPKEWIPLYKIRKKFKAYRADPSSLNELSTKLSDIDFCYAALSKVSRSFAVVIRRLPEDVRDAVCIFYLVLRALDSIEDDTAIAKEMREKTLLEFHDFLSDPEWKMSGVGTNDDYSMLLENFDKVSACYRNLEEGYQQIIQRICKEMAEGMVIYLDKELKRTSEYDEYCYYVAGLVGIGLSEIFVLSGRESAELGNRVDLQIAMGRFLQKTNIIRDFREDLDEGRTFWPHQIWGSYADQLEDLTAVDSDEATHCLNHMVTDALALAPNCVEYLKLIKDPGIFQFCAIPQVMAMSTLAEVFNNPDVFQKNVKIRKGLAAHIFVNTIDMHDALALFQDMARNIFDKVSLSDPNVALEVKHLQSILAETVDKAPEKEQNNTTAKPKEPALLDLQAVYSAKA